MTTSVVIAYRNDPYLFTTLDTLPEGQDSTRFEVVVVDDCSDEPLTIDNSIYPNVRVVRNKVQKGVGYSFDKGISEARGKHIVFMGADIMVKNSNWLDIAEKYCEDYPKGMGCAVCLSLDPDHLDANNPADDVKRYGATIIPLSVTEDLPSDSPLLSSEYYVGAFDSRWIKREPKEAVAEIPCIYGAMYVANKEWYQHVGGWDSDFTRKLSGHTYWGSLEAWISIKNYLYGGTCHVIRELESGHIFHKFRGDRSPHGRTDFFWYNKMFIAYTCMDKADADSLVEKVYSLRLQNELYTLPFNMGRKLIRQNWDYIQSVRERNKKQFVHGFEWFIEKFNIDRKW